jgi:hypothetical protein
MMAALKLHIAYTIVAMLKIVSHWLFWGEGGNKATKIGLKRT